MILINFPNKPLIEVRNLELTLEQISQLLIYISNGTMIKEFLLRLGQQLTKEQFQQVLKTYQESFSNNLEQILADADIPAIEVLGNKE